MLDDIHVSALSTSNSNIDVSIISSLSLWQLVESPSVLLCHCPDWLERFRVIVSSSPATSPTPAISHNLSSSGSTQHINVFIMPHAPPPTTICTISYPTPQILLVTLNRPKELNTIPSAGHWELQRMWQWMDSNPSLLIGIFTGSGRAFCTGADLRGTPPFLSFTHPKV